jgi:hypothetical protein
MIFVVRVIAADIRQPEIVMPFPINQSKFLSINTPLQSRAVHFKSLFQIPFFTHLQHPILAGKNEGKFYL